MNRLLIQFLFALALASGCATAPAKTAQASGHVEQCLVCAYNRDLACIKVAVTDKTPQCSCGGKTYYFCSDDCRKEFEKHPAKYQPRAEAK